MVEKNLTERYGAEEAAWLVVEIRRFWETNSTVNEDGDGDGEALEPSFEYTDNYRLCRVGSDEEKDYEFIRDHGCCGQHDVTFGEEGSSSPGGYTYRYGFNYGH